MTKKVLRTDFKPVISEAGLSYIVHLIEDMNKGTLPEQGLSDLLKNGLEGMVRGLPALLQEHGSDSVQATTAREAVYTVGCFGVMSEIMHKSTRIPRDDCVDILLECFGITVGESGKGK